MPRIRRMQPDDPRQEFSKLDEFGRELPDPVPMAPPVGYKKVPSMVDTIRDMIRSEKLRAYALEQGAETFEEADDLDIDDPDDFEPYSEHEVDDLTPISELRARQSAASQPAAQPGPAAPTAPAPLAPDPSPSPAPTPAKTS